MDGVLQLSASGLARGRSTLHCRCTATTAASVADPTGSSEPLPALSFRTFRPSAPCSPESACCSASCTPLPEQPLQHFIFFAHSVAIGHDAFRDTREKDFVVIQKELVSRSLSEDAFATVRSSFLPASCAPSFPSSPFPSSPLQPRHRRNRHTTPHPLRLTQK